MIGISQGRHRGQHRWFVGAAGIFFLSATLGAAALGLTACAGQ